MYVFLFFPKDTTHHCHNYSSVMQNTRSCPKRMSVFSVPSASIVSGEGVQLSASAICFDGEIGHLLQMMQMSQT